MQRSADTSLRSKRFRLVSEQRKTEERDFLFWPREKWNESQNIPHPPHPFKIPLQPLPALSLAPFFTRSLTLVSLSLLRACYAGYGNISAYNWSKYERALDLRTRSTRFNLKFSACSPKRLVRLFIQKEVILKLSLSRWHMIKPLTFDNLFPPLRHSR